MIRLKVMVGLGRLALFGSLVAGCSFDGSAPASLGSDDGGVGDAPTNTADGAVDGDGAPIVPDAGVGDAALCQDWSYAPLFFASCSLDYTSPPIFSGSPDLVVDTTNLQVRNGPTVVADLSQIDVDGESVALWALSAFDFSGVLQLQGTRSLLIAVDADANISGSIIGTASSSAEPVPAGARATNACSIPIAATMAGGPGENASGGGSGGGGGGYGVTGASAGTGDEDSSYTTGGSAGDLLTPPVGIRGGCEGGIGGSGETSDNVAGGHGGGAIHIAVRGKLSVSGVVTMGGTGGAGAIAGSLAGGGGGGAGGYIGFEGSVVETSGMLAANGGGGGGASSSNGPEGQPGSPGGPGTGVASGGGAGGSDSTAGGAGGAQGIDAISSASSDGGTGGGGGGLGHIRVRAPVRNLGGSSSPTPVESSP